MSLRATTSFLLAAAFVALLGPATAGASEPRWGQAPSIELSGSQLIGSNGGWLTESGEITKYVFRFTRNGVTVKGPDSVPKSAQASAALPAGTYPDDLSANIYNLQAADAGQRMCVEVWGGTRSTHYYGNGTLAYDVWEWGHVNAAGAEAKACLTAPGTATTAPTAPTAPTTPAVPAPQAALAPAATSAPTISGIAMVDETLTATRGVWSGTQPLTVALQWQRCNAEGQECQNLGLSGDTYTVIPFDIGKTLRVRITASNAAGAREAVSQVTDLVTELKPTEQKTWLPAAKVTAPHKLMIDQVSAKPARLMRKSAVTVSLRVSDSRGFRIQGALVTAVVLPGSALVAPAEVETGEDGLVTLRFTPGRKLNLRKAGTITLVITARRPGDRLTSPRGSVVRVKVAIGATRKTSAKR